MAVHTMRHFATYLRLIAFSLAIVGTVVLITWAAETSWEQFEKLDQGIQEEELGSFDIADTFQAKIHSTNYTLVRFGTHETTAERQTFEQQSKELNRWLDERKALLTTPREREVLEQIDRAYDAYLIAAQQVITTAESSNDHKLMFEALERAAQVSKPLLSMGYSLAVANREATKQWREDLRRSIGRLKTVIIVSVLGQLALGAGTSVSVYRQLIAPLRTELAESRELMARQEKLAALGVLAAGVAHEIRNPLTAIKLRLFTLRGELAAAAVDAEDADVIAGEIERLERIVNDFLRFARPADPKLETLPAAAPIQEVHNLLACELKQQGIDLQVEVATEALISADARQLKQVLLNLVRNSAESIDTFGKILLRARTGTGVLGQSRGPCVFIDVEDSGSGIPADVQKQLFDPFFSTKETGTGLGLSIAACIIERHGGVLKFETRPQKGTTFTIVLPHRP
ncbi:ATP-binding protein [Verrucomicrobiota bacterium sgz303538]